MLATNISKSILNLESGACAVGETAQVTSAEVRLLLPQGRIELETAATSSPPPAAPKPIKVTPKADNTQAAKAPAGARKKAVRRKAVKHG